MLVEMRRSAVLRRLGQVRGQLGLWQVQDGLGEVADGVEDTAWKLGLQHRHLGGDEGWIIISSSKTYRWPKHT